MALTEYRRKRNFNRTPEPAGGKPDGGALKFVVQKHQASRLHYDFRLELDGVLVSWAVPKGPSLDPSQKHLAMKVEDHPMDYRLFEGVIPKGNYGAGTVMVWDEGTYSDAEDNADPAEARKHIKAGLKKGDLKVTLHGQKLKGSFVLAHMRTSDEDNAWLLIKHKDEHASRADVTNKDKSTLTGKTMNQIAKTDKQWNPKMKVDLSAAPKQAQPKHLDPMLATLVEAPFDDPEWLYEIKWDGYRILAHLDGGQVKLLSRNAKDYTSVFGPVADELATLKTEAILDGEMVVVDKAGRSDFGSLQAYQKTGQGALRYYVFDIPFAQGHDLRQLPLEQRKQVVAGTIAGLKLIQLSDHIEGRGQDFFAAADKQNLEGIMAKAKASTYQAGKRSRDWLKIKTHRRQEVVIGGYTEPKGSRQKIGAIVAGVYDKSQLVYVGHVGGGFNDKELIDIHKRLEKIEQPESPFNSLFKSNAPVHWVKPKLLAEVAFAEWTSDGHLRQPRFIGMRDDKDPKTVRREQAK